MKKNFIDTVNFADVIHFYKGCQIVVKGWMKEKEFTDTLNIICDMPDGTIEVWGNECECIPLDKVKLVLRNCNDITDSEYTEYRSLCKRELEKNKSGLYKILTTVDTPKSFAWLIKNRFDIFNLKKTQNCVYNTEYNIEPVNVDDLIKIQKERDSKPYEFIKY